MPKLIKVESKGIQETYDLGVEQYHNYIANDIVVHNCMLLARRLAGFSGSEANALRKGLAKGKDNEETMKKLKKLLEDFKSRSQDAIEQGLISQEQLDEYITTLESFGGYGFNKSHAVSYAMVAYWSLFLKTYFPVEFMVALLNFTDLAKKDDQGNVVLKKYIQYAKKLGVTVAPPNINTSETKFSLDANIIRWGLGMVKGLGPAAVAEALKHKPYENLEDFLEKVEKRKLNKSKVVALIKCGAFDDFGDREYLINRYLGEIRKEKGYEFVKFGDEEKQKTEEDLLGMPISFSVLPEDIDYDKLKSEYDIYSLSDLEDMMEGTFIGKIGKIQKKNSQKSGKPMMIVEIADDLEDKKFFVWERDIETVEKKLIIGHIMTVPLKKFDMDSDGCFYNGPIKDLVDLTEE
jgi:DNA polymerase-3 subunit alpha